MTRENCYRNNSPHGTQREECVLESGGLFLRTRQGIDLLTDQQRLPSSAMERNEEEAQHGKDIALDLPPGALEKSTDLVGIYLREMRAVPLLRREEEVDIAKRIERGQLRALKALSRSPIVIRQILAIGKDLKQGEK